LAWGAESQVPRLRRRLGRFEGIQAGDAATPWKIEILARELGGHWVLFPDQRPEERA
jgi:hypothetical protein